VNIKTAQEMQLAKINNTTLINGYALTTQIRKWLKEEESVNMKTKRSK